MSLLSELQNMVRAIASYLPLFIPLGVIGLWRWTMWLAKRIPALAYRPIENDFNCSATIVTAVFREDPALFRRAIASWIANRPDRIIAVIDATDLACFTVAAEFAEVEVICDPTPGKRPKLVKGVDATSTDLVVLVDSDVIWAPDVLRKLKMPFIDPEMGGVSARPYMYPSGDGRPTIWERLADFYLDSRYSTEVAATTRWGQAVSCLSGRTSAYRTQLLQSLREPFLNETFNGKACISGDDKCYTMLVLRQGYKTWHQLDAVIYSTFKPNFQGFTQQRIRWARNSFRSDFRALGQGWIWRHPYLAVMLVDKQLSLLTQLNSPVFFLLAATSGHWRSVLFLVVWWHLSRAVKVCTHLIRRPSEFMLLPLFIGVTFVNALIRIYALFTLNKQGWLTRPVGMENGEVVRLPVASEGLEAAVRQEAQISESCT